LRASVEQRRDVLVFAPCQLIDRPRRDGGFPKRGNLLRSRALPRLAQATGEVVASVGELFERQAVKAIELLLEIGNDGEVRGTQAAAFNASTSSSFVIFE
jgi:hypothetical protein